MHYSLSRAFTWNLAGYLYLIVASFISVPIIFNSLGMIGFGHYALVIATITLASSIDLGLSAAVVRSLSQDHDEHYRVWATSHWLFVGTGLVAAAIAALIVSSFESPVFILPLVFVHTLLGHVLSHYLTLPQARGHFHIFNLRPFVIGTANTIVSAYLASLGFGIDILILTQLLATLGLIIFLRLYTRRHFGTLPIMSASRTHSHDLLGFGIKNQVGKLVGQIGAQYAKFLLAALSPLAVSAYTIGQGIVLKLAGGLTQLSTALYPDSTRRARTRALRSLYHRLQLSLLGLSLLGLAIYYLFGLPFLTWWLKDQELAGAVRGILNYLALYLAVLVLTPLPSVILDSHGKPGTTSLFTTLTIGLEIALALLFFPQHGYLAPAYAAIISVIVTTPALLIVTERTLTRGK